MQPLLAILAASLLGGCARPGTSVSISLAAGGETIRNMNGIQGGPLLVRLPRMDLTPWYEQAAVPLVRFPQDDGQDYALGAIFPDAGADPQDPLAYNFSLVDAQVEAILGAGAEPMWQALYDIGPNERSGQGCCQAGDAPDDPDRWAQVVAHVLMHWNEGWAQGHDWGVRWVEFINEPQTCGGFDDDVEAVFATYRAFADALTDYELAWGRELVIMGPTANWPEGDDLLDTYLEHLEGWLEGRRLDMLSLHAYRDSPWELAQAAAAMGELGDALGVPVCNSEWNVLWYADSWGRQESHWDGVWTATSRVLLEPLLDCSIVCRGPPKFTFPELTEYQDSPFFDFSEQDGDDDYGPLPGWWSFMPFGELAGQERLTVAHDEALSSEGGFAVLAGRSDEGVDILLSSLQWSGTVSLEFHSVPDALVGQLSLLRYRGGAELESWEPLDEGALFLAEGSVLSVEVEAPDLWFLRLRS